MRLVRGLRGRRGHELAEEVLRPLPASSPSGRRAHRRHSWDSRAAWPSARAKLRELRDDRRACRWRRLFSVRVQELLKIFSRTARSVSETSAGCCVVFCSGMTYLPGILRSSAALAAAAISSSLKPARSALLSVTNAPAFVAADQLLLELASESDASCLLISRSSSLSASDRFGAGMDELAVIDLQKLQRFRIELQRIALRHRRPSRARRACRSGRSRRHARQASAPRRTAPCRAYRWCWPDTTPKNARRAVQHAARLSSATIVFSKVGFALLFAIASTSAICCFMPSSKRGLIVAVLDLVERRRVQRQRARAQKRTLRHRGCGRLGADRTQR